MINQDFFSNVAKVLAHTVMYEARLEHERETGGTVGFSEMRNEDPPPYDPNRQYTETARGFNAAYPNYINQISQQILPYESARMTAAEALAPREAMLMRNLAPMYGELSAATMAADRAADPAYWGLRDKAIEGAGDLIGAYDIDGGLSAGERASTEREIGQLNAMSGRTNSNDADRTIGAAMKFGGKYDEKVANFGAALNNANSLLAGNKPAVTAARAADATTRGFANAGNLGQTTAQSGADLWASGAGFAQQHQEIDSQRRDGLDRGMEVVGTLGSY